MNDPTAMQILIGAVIFVIVLIDRLMPHRCKDCQRRHEEEYNRRCQAHYASFRPPVPTTGSGVRPPSGGSSGKPPDGVIVFQGQASFAPRTMKTPTNSSPPNPRKR